MDQTQAAYDAEIQRNAAAVRNGDGLLARLRALERISTGDDVLLTAHAALFLFFTAIECLPVLFKLLLYMAKPSLYELLTTIEDQTTYADAVRGFRAAQDEREIDVRTALESHDTRRRNQMRAEVETAQRVLDAQKSLAPRRLLLGKPARRRVSTRILTCPSPNRPIWRRLDWLTARCRASPVPQRGRGAPRVQLARSSPTAVGA